MGEAALKENSMEDILASIRRIITSENGSQSPADMTGELNPPVTREVAEKPVSTGTSDSVAAARTQPDSPAGSTKSVSVNTVKEAAGLKTASLSPGRNTAGEGSENTSAPSSTTLADIARGVLVKEATGSAKSAPLADKSSSSPEITLAKGLETDPGSAKTIAPAKTVADTAADKDAKRDQTGSETAEEDNFRKALNSAEKPPQVQTAGKHNEPVAAMVAHSTEEAVNTSIDRLKKSMVGNEAAQTEVMLRPLLKEWLDENLPDLVEKIVRHEVERLISKS